jgi:hypothetical protein
MIVPHLFELITLSIIAFVIFIRTIMKTWTGGWNNSIDPSIPGSMQLAELGRPFTGGSWCGSGEGRASYYSETSTVTASIRLFAAPSNVPFEFRLRYHFVSRLEAIARLGSPEAPIERGSPVPGTYCSRNFYECYQKTCRLQSPNYPGEYPRNATCLITLRQKEVMIIHRCYLTCLSNYYLSKFLYFNFKHCQSN